MSKSRSGAPRRVAAGLLAGALAVFGVALAPPAGAVDDVVTDRVAGPTRYSTAGAIAGQADFDGATTAILATGENFPDALAASGLAGANAPAPIILTETEQLTDAASIAMTQIESLDDVLVVGGTAAIQDDVVAEVEDAGYTVTRIAGVDRYETAAAIAAEVTPGEVDGLRTALIASGEVFADAVAGGPVAYAGQHPVLLVNTEGVPAATAAALEEADIEQVILLGGTARITEETATELSNAVGNPAVRVAGVDRFATAADIARFAEAEFGWAPSEVLLANGLNFPDALACGPLGGERSAPIVLTASIPEPTATYLDEVSDTLRKITACGGTAAVSEEDLTGAETLGETTDNDAATGGDTQTSALQGPELQSAAISGLELDDLAISYTFTFDQELDEDSVNPEMFKLYNTDTREPALGDEFNGGDEVEVDGETVIVVFNLADYGVANATLAAVEEGAVEDENGNPNPAQSVATAGVVNGSGTGVVAASIEDEDEGVVEIEFGSPQAPGTPSANLYQLITKEGDVFTCTPADAVATGFGYSDCTAETLPDDDESSTTVEVTFLCTGDDAPATFNTDSPDEDDDPCDGATAGDGADFSDQNIRRLAVVSIAGGRINTVDLASGGSTDAPDLVDVQLASDNEDLEDNEALFIFDEEIDTIDTSPAGAAAYDLVYSICDIALPQTAPIALINAAQAADTDTTYEDPDGEGYDDTVDFPGGCMLSATSVNVANDVDDDFSERAVLATFVDDDIDNEFLTAAQVSSAAGVSETDADNLSNDNDEVELGSDQPPSLWDDGEVSGPQLVGATVEVDTTFGGTFDAWVLTLEFDKELNDVALAGAITFFFDDGENVESEDVTGCEVDDDTNIVCEITDDDSDFANATVVSVEYETVFTDDTFTVSDDAQDINFRFPNPEASIEIEVPDISDIVEED